uniref:DUF6782 family putative metallopeptidase n=1 Tax=Carnobacterium TaxID=2747 RepID=UPI00344DED4C
MAIKHQSKIDRKEKIKQLTDSMNEAVKNYQTDPKDEMELLESLARFKNYSAKNTLLAKAQYKGAYGIASYKDFQKLGYQVQKGEKSLSIFAPKIEQLFKDEEDKLRPIKFATKQQKEKIKNGLLKKVEKKNSYVAVPIFDITQTDCPPEDYPKLYPNKPESFKFKGTEEEFDVLNKSLKHYAKEQGLHIRVGKTDSAAKGYYVPSTNNIVLKDTLDSKEKVKVLLHEMAHAEMHHTSKLATKSKEMRTTTVLEYQAEMTAYVVSTTFGLDSEDYSKSYLANWTKRNVDHSVYVKSLQEVKDVALTMIDKVIDKYNTIKLNRDASQNGSNKNLDQLNSLEPEDKIAIKLNFLSDEKGKNYFNELKNESLTCTGIKKIKSSKSFSDYTIKLEDKNSHIFHYRIRSEKNKKEINEEWTKELTGKEWLNQDIKTEVLKRKPTISIDNPIPEDRMNMRSIKDYFNQNKELEMKL